MPGRDPLRLAPLDRYRSAIRRARRSLVHRTNRNGLQGRPPPNTRDIGWKEPFSECRLPENSSFAPRSSAEMENVRFLVGTVSLVLVAKSRGCVTAIPERSDCEREKGGRVHQVTHDGGITQEADRILMIEGGWVHQVDKYDQRKLLSRLKETCAGAGAGEETRVHRFTLFPLLMPLFPVRYTTA